MAKKYIEADELKQTFCAECNHTLKCEDCDIDYHFRYAPAADVQEVKHGRWELYDICSVCGAQAEQPTNYCPTCGAKMDEVTE